MHKNYGNTIAIPIGIFGFFIFMMLIMMIIPSLNGIGCTLKVNAEVVELVSDTHTSTSHKSNGRTRTSTSTVYAPVYKFYIDDIEQIVQSNTYSSPPAHSVGDKVQIKVDPDDPSRIYDPLPPLFYIIPSVIIVIFTALIIAVIVSDRKVKPVMGAVFDSDSLYS